MASPLTHLSTYRPANIVPVSVAIETGAFLFTPYSVTSVFARGLVVDFPLMEC